MGNLRIYFDTQVYSDSRLADEKWRRRLRMSKYRCDLSPITLLELLDGIARTRTDTDFQKAQRPLDIAWRMGGKNVLNFPGRFALEEIFGIQNRKWKFGKEDFRQWHSVAVRARDRHNLFGGQVPWPSGVSRRKICGLDPQVITSQLQEGRYGYVQQIRNYVSELKPDWEVKRKQGVRNLLTRGEQRTLERVLEGEPVRNAFFNGLLQILGLAPDDILQSHTVEEVVSKCDAAFAHRKYIFRQVLTTPYNFEEDASAYHDFQQLYYLADPRYLFVTEDGGLREAIAKSSQADRVISLEELARLISH